MKTFKVLLKSINDVKDFVNTSNKYNCEINLSTGRYVVDAKSIMGLFSLDLSKPIKVEILCGNSERFCEEVKRFMVE